MKGMSHRISAAMSLAAALCAVEAARADYQGMQVRLHSTVNAGGQNRSVYRVYATFNDPGDFLTTVFGSPNLGTMHIQSLDSSGQFPGGDFYNPGGIPGTTMDTAPAIGQFTGISPSPGFDFNDFIIGTQHIQPNGGWFTAGPLAQGMAGNGVLLPGGLWGVLAMQLTVNAGNHVRGTVGVAGVNMSSLAGGTTFITLADQTFNSFPAPPTAALAALALWKGSRRRQ